ncbi:FAD:protein FMN transferase [Gryllotalpicola protaetiae]|uniref:FAD:protein FMN transferase n=2 Tax=Gryllotalpicola protaetiae TaxID=2419771 RepID=A0A387BRN4_9MICO|nr:FAD:protein FMN transferase [Gryllotalpicola protaetiae]
MGTVVSLDLRTAAPDEIVTRAFAIFDEADARFSPFRDDSELSRIGRGELPLQGASADMDEVLALASAFERASGGAFSVWRSNVLDANGVVKGWAAQRAAAVLDAGGAADFCLNAGGDMIAHGVPADGQQWQVGIRDPRRADRLLGTVVLGEGALATSGTYERGAHIVDARTGEASHHWSSITVLDPDLTVADVLATAAFAMGADGPAWAHEEFGSSVIAVDDTGRMVVSGPVKWARG